jgi:hypothetical protein
VIRLELSARSNSGRALRCAMAAPMRKAPSRFLDLFDPTKEHPFDLHGPGIHNRELFFGKQMQAASKRGVLVQLAGRPVTNEKKLSLFRTGRSAVAFGGICRDRRCSAPDLAGQAEHLLSWGKARDWVQVKGRSMLFPPVARLGEILNSPHSCSITQDTGLQIKTKNCQRNPGSSYAA